mmetsp:Transcript_27633/g.87608  ORF Transcript_27633/g.87608 Transcript_27633/m.87608 type:complete len:825 (-) Transcript_27633:426-2900(-)
MADRQRRRSSAVNKSIDDAERQKLIANANNMREREKDLAEREKEVGRMRSGWNGMVADLKTKERLMKELHDEISGKETYIKKLIKREKETNGALQNANKQVEALERQLRQQQQQLQEAAAFQKQRADLERKLKEFERTNQSLAEQVMKLDAQVVRHDDAVNKLKLAADDAKLQRDHAEAAKSEAELRLEDLEEELCTLRKNVVESDAAATYAAQTESNLRTELANAQADMKMLGESSGARIKDLENEKGRLNTMLGSEKMATAAAEREKIELKGALGEAQSRVHALEEEVAALAAQTQAEKDRALQQAAAELKEKDAVVKAAQVERDTLKAEVQALRKAADEARSLAEAHAAALDEHVAQLEGQVKELEHGKLALHEDIAALRREKGQEAQRADEASERLEKLQSNLSAELEERETRLHDEMAAERAEQSGVVSELQEQLDKLNEALLSNKDKEENLRLTASVADLQAKLDEATEQVRTSQNELADADDRYRELEDKLKGVADEHAEVIRSRDARWQEVLNTLKKKAADAAEAADAARVKSSVREMDATKASDDAARFKTQMNTAIQQAMKARKRIKMLERRAAQAEAQRDDLQDHSRRLQERLSVLEDEAQRAKDGAARAAHASKASAAAEKKLGQLESALRRAEMELDMCRGRLEKQEAMTAEKERALVARTRDMEEAFEDIRDAEEEFLHREEDLRAEVARLKKQLYETMKARGDGAGFGGSGGPGSGAPSAAQVRADFEEKNRNLEQYFRGELRNRDGVIEDLKSDSKQKEVMLREYNKRLDASRAEIEALKRKLLRSVKKKKKGASKSPLAEAGAQAVR